MAYWRKTLDAETLALKKKVRESVKLKDSYTSDELEELLRYSIVNHNHEALTEFLHAMTRKGGKEIFRKENIGNG
ncbi:hypothetical protein P4489_06670 [Heyndrickxia sporothermodurans]|uniref:hypothetical protein n=1 Tax=Heyndrickxia sporothermodurans TaxID=46224 RepID=UPI002E208B23|nr:hypothetical protein [Heyndrickxia sporothermodurans]